jgi:hypothetical protein
VVPFFFDYTSKEDSRKKNMGRTLSNTPAASSTAASTELSTFSAAGLTFKDGYETHPSYPVQLQSMAYTDSDGAKRKRVWMRGAVKKSAKDSDALFQNADIVYNIPTELRPSQAHTYVCALYDAGGGSDRRLERHVNIQTTGSVHAWGVDGDALSTEAGSSLTLDGICWTT